MRKKSITFLVFCLVAMSSIAYANTIVDLIGDKDGFGIGATKGTTFDSLSIGGGDGDGTDVWRSGDYTYTHTYDISGLGTITSASLELFTGGIGQGQPPKLFIYIGDGIDAAYVDELTVGQSGNTNYARIDIVDLINYLPRLNGEITLAIDTHVNGDDWVLDYSQLTISDKASDNGPFPNPEPATMILFGLGLLGIAGVSRKKLQK